MGVVSLKPTKLQRFLSHIEIQPNGCWLWMGARYKNGYGAFNGNCAHIFAFEIFVGKRTAGLDLDRTCHNADKSCDGGWTCIHRPCVCPWHLDETTRRENLVRGKTLIADQLKRTQCPAGHPYNEANTYWEVSGCKRCKTCNREKCKRRASRRKAVSI